MLAASGTKAVTEPEEIFLVDRVQHLDKRALDNLVFQCGDAERALPPVELRDIPTPRRLRSIGSSVDSAVQILKASLEVMAVILPCHAIDARSRLALERQVGFPELIAVQERGEPFLLLQPCALPYAFQAVGRAVPARCPGRASCSAFSLAPALGSTNSSAGRPASFARFTVTHGGVWPERLKPGRHRERPPGRRARGAAIQRFRSTVGHVLRARQTRAESVLGRQ